MMREFQNDNYYKTEKKKLMKFMNPTVEREFEITYKFLECASGTS